MRLASLFFLPACSLALLSGCASPSAPAPVQVSPSTSASEWVWQDNQSEQVASSTPGQPSDSTAPTPSGTPETPNDAQAKRSLANHPSTGGQPIAQVGECVNLNRGEDGHTTFITKSCNEPHHAQVVGFVDLSDGPNAPAPALARLQGVAGEHCPILVSEFIGQPMQERQDLTLNWTGPARREWNQGARTIVCLASGPINAEKTGTNDLTRDLRAGAPPAPNPPAQAPSSAPSAVAPAPPAPGN